MPKILQQIKNISILLNPIIPNSTNKVLSSLNLPIDKINIDYIKDMNILNSKKEINELKILFDKIENDN